VGKVAELDRIEAIRLLVAIGFDLNPTDRRTPLHEAVTHGNRALVEMGTGSVSTPPDRASPDHRLLPWSSSTFRRQRLLEPGT
jgi:ankyrin repeat protein